MDIKTERKINKQIAHIMASYGDLPDELMFKIHELIIEWHCKGIAIGMDSLSKQQEKNLNTKESK